jgi:hypothetical protein
MNTRTPLLAGALLAGACAADLEIGPGDYTKSDSKADTSAEAIFVDFEFDGEVLASSGFAPASTIEDQLLYTIGHLNGDRAVGRLDKLVLTDIETEKVGEMTRITYHARMPVAWGRKSDVPSSYTLTLPADISFAGQQAFTDKYSGSCIDFGAHDVTPGSMWYYYRTEAFGCELDPADVVELDAAVSISDINTTGKFPEYHKVWEDEALRVVAVFGKYEDGATGGSDAGIAAYNRFVSAIGDELAGHDLTTVPAEVPFNPGVDTPDISFTARLADGSTVVVNALLVDNVRTAGAAFDARYGELSSRADLIVYNGHAGLGANIRALARKGEWVTGQYAVVFMNGCDTYAYVDSALNDAHAAINPDDPTGTKYVDIVTNALPSFFRSMPGATMALVRGLMARDNPQTYEQMFRFIDRAEVVLVSGEQDNTFVPGGGGGEPEAWDGFFDAGRLARGEELRFETPVLAAGRYLFDLTGTGDADLYVRVGLAPNTTDFDCRPFRSGSTESCEIELPAPAPIHVMVRGFSSDSEFEVEGAPLN